MSRFACVLILVLAAMPFRLAHAAEFSGDYLMQMCLSDKQGGELVPGAHNACQSYIAGVMDYHNLIKSLGTSPSVEFCVPEGTPLNDIQRKIATYLYRHKHSQGPFIAAPAVALGLNQYYPCNKAGKPAKKKKPQ
ncbi:MAG: hypothetical protein KTR28_04770 [Micavibrio sp.]|nr:hypothetical protein [Micavibrio sp.]